MSKRVKGRDQGPTPLDSQSPLTLATLDGYLHLPSHSRLPIKGAEGGTLTHRRAVFLDRDGVLVEDVHYLTSPDQLRLLPSAASALGRLQDQFFIIVVTNQSAIARGFMTEDDLMNIHAELASLFASEGITVDALYYCPHLPEAAVPTYKIDCTCRKPGPGMLLRAAADWHIDLNRAFMIGDTPRDSEAALAAGVVPIMVGDFPQGPSQRVKRVRNLMEASRVILDTEPSLAEEWEDHHSGISV